MDDFFLAGKTPKLSDEYPDLAKKYPAEAAEVDAEQATAKPPIVNPTAIAVSAFKSPPQSPDRDNYSPSSHPMIARA